MHDETRKIVSSKREKLEKELPNDFSWAMLYELSVKEFNIIRLAVSGDLETFTKDAKEGCNLNDFLLQKSIRDLESNDQNDEPYTGGHGGLFTEHDVYAVHYAGMGMLLGLFYYGEYTNDLVLKAKKGDLDAYFKAIRIDQTILTIPAFSSQLVRARMFGDKRFMLRLHSALKSKPHEALLMHQDLRFMLQIFYEANALQELTLTNSDMLLINELKLYPNKGDDPSRSLMRYIQRWKAEKNSTT